MRLNLPFTALTILKNSSIWNIQKIGWGNDNNNHKILQDDILKVFYPNGSYSPSKYPQGGIGFYSSPYDIFPAKDVILSYEIKFDKTFEPVLGGKLPGLFLSEGISKKYIKDASGGHKNNKTASLRIAWRQDFYGEAYIYVPQIQSKEYKNIPNLIRNKIYGDSLWRGLFKFKKNTWNIINIRLKLNSFYKNNLAKDDGLIEVSINNENYKFNKLIWRTNNTTCITAILFSTFFGGSSSKYATQHDTWTYFRNLQILKLK